MTAKASVIDRPVVLWRRDCEYGGVNCAVAATDSGRGSEDFGSHGFSPEFISVSCADHILLHPRVLHVC